MVLIFGVGEVNIKTLLAQKDVASQTLKFCVTYSFYWHGKLKASLASLEAFDNGRMRNWRLDCLALTENPQLAYLIFVNRMELLAIVASYQFLSAILSWYWKTYALSDGCDVILLQETMRTVKMLASSADLQYISEIASQTVRASRFFDFLEERLLSRCRGSNTLLKSFLIKSIR